jgi:hypothetical protein
MKTQAILLVVVCALRVANAQAIMEPADRVVTLSGVIRLIHGCGPPGYGEDKKTDVHVSYFAIELPKPINIPCAPQLPELKSIQCGATRRLRLFFPSEIGDGLKEMALELQGRNAVLTGTLQRRTTMAEMTPIMIEVTAIRAANSGIEGNVQ